MASIYGTSKTKHAARWKALRAAGVPIISTWIDDAGAGETSDWGDLWCRCIDEAARATALVAFNDDGEAPNGSLLEIGAALGGGTHVYAVGFGPEHTWQDHPGVTKCGDVGTALHLAMHRGGESVSALQSNTWRRAWKEAAQSGSAGPTEPAPPPEDVVVHHVYGVMPKPPAPGWEVMRAIDEWPLTDASKPPVRR